jgi:hypothetical protein
MGAVSMLSTMRSTILCALRVTLLLKNTCLKSWDKLQQKFTENAVENGPRDVLQELVLVRVVLWAGTRNFRVPQVVPGIPCSFPNNTFGG